MIRFQLSLFDDPPMPVWGYIWNARSWSRWMRGDFTAAERAELAREEAASDKAHSD